MHQSKSLFTTGGAGRAKPLAGQVIMDQGQDIFLVLDHQNMLSGLCMPF